MTVPSRASGHSFLPPPKPVLNPERVEGSKGGGAFRFPGPRDRVTINGMTGSGKSTFALWLFAESADFDKKPWIMIDFKKEELIGQALSEGMFRERDVGAEIPAKPGVYVVRHNAREGMARVVDFLWAVYERGRVGLFLDEASMLPELRGEANSGGPFQSILSQGRSKEIPAWVLAQRPVNINNMVFTENQFYSAFELAGEDDFKKITKHIPKHSADYDRVWDSERILPDHWSRWYDRGAKRSFILRPCPPSEKILDILAKRLDGAREHEAI